MKGSLITVLSIAGAAAAIPAQQIRRADPVRILPFSWQFEIASFEGPGCPKVVDPTKERETRPTYGENTVDGSEIYYWYFAYPGIQAKIGPGIDKKESSTWCTTELKYTELADYETREPSSDYLLKLHKNGTSMLANYELDDGVTANWKFTYYPEDHDEVVDEITINGPFANEDVDAWHTTKSYSPSNADSPRWSLPKCGAGTIRYKTELTLTSKTPEGKGIATSELITDPATEISTRYGIQQGVSYDWEKCKK